MPASAAPAERGARHPGGQLCPRHDQVSADPVLIGAPASAHGGRAAAARRLGPEQGQHRVVADHVLRLDPEHEPHRGQELKQRRARARLDVGPGRRAVIGQGEVVLDVTLGAEDQRLGARARLSCSKSWVVRLCSQLSRSGPVMRSTPRLDRSTTPQRAGERALLGVRVAVVRRDARVRRRRPRRRRARPAAGCQRLAWLGGCS